MPKRVQIRREAHVLIEGRQVDAVSRWVFTVSLVRADGAKQTRWIGRSYEQAILEAERWALVRQGDVSRFLQVFDQVVPAR